MRPSAPMSLSEIFDRLLKLIARTWLRNLIVCSIVMAVPLIAFAIGMNSYINSIIGLVGMKDLAATPTPLEVFRMMGGMMIFFAALFLFLAAQLVATLGVTITGCAEINDIPLQWREVMNRMFGIRLLRLVGQKILELAAFIALFIFPVMLIIIAAIAHSIWMAVFGVLLVLAAVLFMIFLIMKWMFTIPLIGWEDAEIIPAFQRSWSLVRGNWWRVFGILTLMNIIVSFGISLVSTPLTFISLWDVFLQQFRLFGTHSWDHAGPQEILGTFRTVGWRLGIINGVTSVAELLITPLVVTVLYHDLLTREKKPAEPPEIPPAPVV